MAEFRRTESANPDCLENCDEVEFDVFGKYQMSNSNPPTGGLRCSSIWIVLTYLDVTSTCSDAQTERGKGPYLNDVRKIFKIFDPSPPPLSAIGADLQY